MQSALFSLSLAVTIASLPVELRDMILDTLWNILLLEARTTVLRRIMLCGCPLEKYDWKPSNPALKDSLAGSQSMALASRTFQIGCRSLSAETKRAKGHDST
jgi:hypothetical protein